jgi:DNA-binding transcriptional LysR family regulator
MNSLYGIYEAVRNDAGLGVLPDYLSVRDTNIQNCLENKERPSVTMYFVYHEERKNSNRINLLQDFLSDAMENTQF